MSRILGTCDDACLVADGRSEQDHADEIQRTVFEHPGMSDIDLMRHVRATMGDRFDPELYEAARDALVDSGEVEYESNGAEDFYSISA